MATPKPPSKLPPLQLTGAIVLTFIAGYVDAVGFLRLSGTYTANMSGNTVALGIHFAGGAWRAALEKALPIGFYILGLIFCRTAVELALVYGFRRIVALLLAAEIAFLGLFIDAGTHFTALLFAALAMGTQAALLARFGDVTIYTTFVTGSLVKFADSAGEAVVSLVKPDVVLRKRALVNACWFFGVWLAYAAGACSSVPVYRAKGAAAVAGPAVMLAGLLFFDLIRPGQFHPEMKS